MASRAQTRRAVEHADSVAAGSRPQTRADCQDGPRPCPWTTCRFHLGRNAPAPTDSDVPETCALDVAERGPLRTVEIAELLGMKKTTAFAALASALRKLRAAMDDDGCDDEDSR